MSDHRVSSSFDFDDNRNVRPAAFGKLNFNRPAKDDFVGGEENDRSMIVSAVMTYV